MKEELFNRSLGVMDVLYDRSINVFSPPVQDYERVVNYDDEKREVVSYVPVDYQKVNEMLGSVDNWNIDSLLKAGINPAFSVHTGSMVSRIEGVADVQNFESQAAIVLEENKSE